MSVNRSRIPADFRRHGGDSSSPLHIENAAKVLKFSSTGKPTRYYSPF